MAKPQPAERDTPCPAALSRHARRSRTRRRFAGALAGALAAADVAAVLLRLARRRAHADQPRQDARAASCSRRAPRCCSTAMPDIVARAGADGAHLTGIEAFAAAVERAQARPHRRLRRAAAPAHDAMLAAERGADYVMFGEPDADGRRPSFDAIVERVAWWAEVFEIPCVGFAATLDEVGAARARRRRFRRGRRLSSGTIRAAPPRRSRDAAARLPRRRRSA